MNFSPRALEKVQSQDYPRVPQATLLQLPQLGSYPKAYGEGIEDKFPFVPGRWTGHVSLDLIQSLIVKECERDIYLIGNGYCNDETNIEECNFDGGECCGNANTDKCYNCTCFYEEMCKAGNPPSLVGDGFCHDETNIFECNYDGGDCCVNRNTKHCSNCKCYGYGSITSPGYPYSYGHNLDLHWLIEVPLGHYIAFTDDYFHIEASSNCR